MVGLDHKESAVTGNKKIGSSLTYIYIDTVNHKITFVVNGTEVDSWG